MIHRSASAGRAAQATRTQGARRARAGARFARSTEGGDMSSTPNPDDEPHQPDERPSASDDSRSLGPSD
ncbi:hypothetical protein A33K_14024 [Burkholderia humptydooensis MSMB43]|uniref:Uncharacterized protein n=1 Tax=Burkholderia humptydooensis MSMB43 TaxID=441157 RepID=A0ABN0GDN9_9BURK|nr:hypothetical protein A33K_14024 [Burkholderia humptydooensis MSMB43]